MKIENVKDYIVEPSSVINEALQKLESNEHKILFVLDNGKLVGSISDGDIRRHLLIDKKLFHTKDCMNNNPFYINKNIDEYSSRKLILKREIFIVPILDNHNELIEIVDLRLNRYFPIDVVVMAGGRGKRLSPLTNKLPKPLIELNGKPIIDYNYDNLLNLGVKSFYISVNYLKNQVISHFKEKSSFKFVQFIEEENPLGTFGSLSLVDDFVNDNIMVINSDILTNIDFDLFYEKFLESKCDIGLVSISYSSKIPYAILLEKDCKLINFQEKPSYDYLINTGIYLLNKKAISEIPKNEFYNATDLLKNIFNANKSVFIHKVNNYWKDIGKIDDLNQAKNDVLNIFNNG